jgi:hypothetical protein
VPSFAIEYRLRIKTPSNQFVPDPITDALVITSTPSGTNPYIAAPPSGDGQELDPVTGSVRTGSYVVEVVDAVTGTTGTGTVRVVTSALEDTQLRQQLLSRRAFVETRTDGGAWATLTAGYITNIRLVSPARYAITVGDTRRIEAVPVLAYETRVSPTNIRGCLIGGPVTADFGPARFRGGWEYEVTGVSGRVVSVAFRRGYSPINGSAIVTNIERLIRPGVVDAINNLGQTFAPVPIGPFGGGRVVLDLTLYIGTTPTNAQPTDVQIALPGWVGANLDSYGLQYLDLYWPTTSPVPIPSSGARLWVSMAQTTISPLCPLLVDAHPVDIVLSVWNQNAIYYDPSAAWISTIRQLIGADVRLAIRLTETPTIEGFLRNAIYGPFGVAPRTNAQGQQELVASRIRTDSTPPYAILPGDLASADPVVFDIDEKSAVASVTITQQVIRRWDSGPAQDSNIPSDGLSVVATTQRITNADAFAFVYGARDIEYSVPGMVHNAASFEATVTEFLQAVGRETIDRFQAGASTAEVAMLASAADASRIQVGDEVAFDAPHFPNQGYRQGESSIGFRIMQVIRRTETPTGPLLRLLDSGGANQPVSPAATISIAQNANLPTLVAAYTITNAAAINATNRLSVEVEWATGAVAPTGNGQTHTIYPPTEVPTGAVDLPAVTGSGVTVYARARTLQLGRRPSAWTAWVSVALNAQPTPGAITVSGQTTTSADIAWTNTSSAYPIAIFAYQGTAAPANWAPYQLNAIEAGSTFTTVRALTGPSVAWVVALAYETPVGLGPFRTATLTTGTSTAASTRPAGLQVVTTIDDAQLPQGIALGLWANDPTLDLIVERSTTGGGVGFAEIARVNGSSETYADLLPRDGTTYHYRLKHALGGYTTSNPTGEVTGIARGIPSPVIRPGPVTPTVRVEVTETSTTATLTLLVLDPQGRTSQVRFRHDSGSGFGAWTVVSPTIISADEDSYAYSATIPVTGFLRIEYEVQGFDADGVDRVLAGGVESFDRGTSADLVSAVGSFGPAGDFVLAIAADTDTASIKYVLSTTSQPNLATVQAASPLNGRNFVQTFAGPYDLGAVLYVSILAYTGAGGTGAESGLFEYQYQRQASAVQCLATETASTNTTSTVTVAALFPNGTAISGAQVQLVSLDGPSPGVATIASGSAVGVWTAAPGTWVFNRGTPLTGSSDAVFRARRGASNPNETDDDAIVIVEEGRDTRPLRSRARLITTTATQAVVRVAVNVPSPYGAASATITYEPTGVGTISPASGQTVTTGVGDFTIPETAGSFVDFTVDRPAPNSNAGQVTFTAVATGFAPDTDPIAIPPQTAIVRCVATETASTNTSSTVTVSAIDQTGAAITGAQVALIALSGPSPGAATVASSPGGVGTGTYVTAPASWTFTRGDQLNGSSEALFRARRSATLTNDTADATALITGEERDTKALVARARVVSSTATTLTVRLAVVTPSPYGAASVTATYATQGLAAVSPTSGQTFTSGVAPLADPNVSPEPAGTFVDFTVPMPAPNAIEGAIAFTVTSSGFGAATTSLTVSPQTAIVRCVAVETASTNTSSTVTVSAIDQTGAAITGAQVALLALDGPTVGKATVSSSPGGIGLGTYTTAPASWVFARGAALSGSSDASFRARRSATLTNDTGDASSKIEPTGKDFTPPTFSPTLTLTSTTGQVSWPAVAVGVTVEGSNDNVTFTTATGTVYPTAATGRNAFGGATKFLFVRAYNAAGVYTPTTAFAVPPQDPTVPAITRFTSASLTLRYATDPTRPNEFQLDYTISNFPTSGSVNAVILQDGVDIGIPVASGTPSQTQGFWASPVALNATGSPAIEWSIYLEVLDSTGNNVEATSKTLTATSYV